MKEVWMIDVLADLRKYALNNEMSALADQLNATIHVATNEMAPQAGGKAFVGHCADKVRGVL
ncbi:hypothetical protein F9L33_00340 [Amylibacter sp. SFDW26]|uniref:hypothetical protein n=1 Tax=Amylibacter sp. SFDW26 TaxID=2652722 RepID=UPI001262266F|nr:hypothetical protein [Amylibacter sp. SFDW26]KAB7615253.1 hypothetical protein F9L33_00340 [Amylibacter sp. SFDW26]